MACENFMKFKHQWSNILFEPSDHSFMYHLWLFSLLQGQCWVGNCDKNRIATKSYKINTTYSLIL